MSKPLVTPQIKKQAQHWVCCLNRGLNQQEKPELIAWVNQNPAHHYALYKVASFFDDISELHTLNGIFPLESPPKVFSFVNTKWLIVFMLSLLLILAGSFITQTLFTDSEPVYDSYNYQTRIGEITTVELPDGSLVTLNTNSRLQVQFSNRHRSVNLLFGEAQFDVAKDAERPFTVTSGAKSFTALGTIFNIQKNNESDMELVVSEGKVLISESYFSNDQLSQMIKTESAKFESPKIITHGEKSIITNATQLATLNLSSKQTDKELAWQQGMLVFNGETLTQALNEVSRYSNVQFELTDDKISKIKIAGYFKAGDIDGLLAALSYNFGIKSKFNATNSVQLSRVNNS